MDIGKTIAQLQRNITVLQRASRLGHASIENAAVLVNDGSGSLRGIIGVQADGTTAVTIVNGAAPPQPSVPTVASVLGGVTVAWDGTFTGGQLLPLDWSRVEVHASTASTYTPSAATLQGTIETPQGATVVVPTDTAVYVCLLARNTSGTASDPSAIVGPTGPAAVVAADILDGIVTEVKLANDAVTQAKIAAGAVGTSELADAAVHAQQLADAAVEVAKIANNAVTGPAIASDAVTANKIAADAVTAVKIQAGAVTAAKVAAGAITTDKLTVTGGANLLTDPSFEGAYTTSIIAGLTFASQDTAVANGSATSLKFDCTAATATTRQVVVTNIPTLPGEQYNLAFDYWVSTDWNGSEVDFQIRWETAAGALISFGKATTTSPARTAWTRLSATVTAPATAGNAKVRCESVGATAGIVRFDNASVRPVLGGTQIQDGAVTTEKVVAGGIQAANIAAGAIQTDKLAAEAVTAAKIQALTITGDRLAANTITVGKLAAGSVDATALAADAITGKTITGGTITGALIQTAASGQRITLNEAGANKVLVYNGSGTAIGELSASGLLVKGTNGAIIQLDPNNTFPNLKFFNSAGTKSAVVNISGSDALLGLNSGLFTSGAETDWKWRTLFGSSSGTEVWAAERVRDSDASIRLGGRIFLDSTHATIGYSNSADSSQDATMTFWNSGMAQATARLELYPAASANTGFLVNGATGHTGPLARLALNGAEKFAVDKDGNLTVAGIGQRITKRRTSDATPKVSTTTVTADTQITFTVDANAVYIIEGFLKYSGPGDFQMGWSTPFGALGEWQGIGNGTTVASSTNTNTIQTDVVTSWGYTLRTESTDIAATRTYGGISSTTFGVQVRGTLRVGATGGTFALTWAQGTSNATGTILYTDSHIQLEKVA